MAKGQPDFGALAPTETIAGLSDMGELAARLGSVVIFDRRGNVIAIDYFDSGIEQWHKYGDAGYSVDWDGNYAKSGAFSCKLTTGPVAGNTVTIERYISVPVLSSLGMEVSFSYLKNWRYLNLEMQILDGIYAYLARIRLDYVNNKLQYFDSAAHYQDIPGGSYICGEVPNEFDTLKFVADFTTAKYKRLISNNREFDLSEIDIRKYGQVETPLMYCSAVLTTNAAEAAIGYIDDIIITQNEP
jgi:hypothetical protein